MSASSKQSRITRLLLGLVYSLLILSVAVAGLLILEAWSRADASPQQATAAAALATAMAVVPAVATWGIERIISA
jgi:uncharacterized membrane protein YcjF (UPF0283 family)